MDPGHVAIHSRSTVATDNRFAEGLQAPTLIAALFADRHISQQGWTKRSALE
jgi:hypothetical protein